MNTSTAVGPVPLIVRQNELYYWVDNPRYISPTTKVRVRDGGGIKINSAQNRYVKLAKRNSRDDGHIEGILSSIYLFGLLDNPCAPISVCRLDGGGYVVVDGNARIIALRDLLGDPEWRKRDPAYTTRLETGIKVLYFGHWDDHDDRTAAITHSAIIHTADLEGFEF